MRDFQSPTMKPNIPYKLGNPLGWVGSGQVGLSMTGNLYRFKLNPSAFINWVENFSQLEPDREVRKFNQDLQFFFDQICLVGGLKIKNELNLNSIQKYKG